MCGGYVFLHTHYTHTLLCGGYGLAHAVYIIIYTIVRFKRLGGKHLVSDVGHGLKILHLLLIHSNFLHTLGWGAYLFITYPRPRLGHKTSQHSWFEDTTYPL